MRVHSRLAALLFEPLWDAPQRQPAPSGSDSASTAMGVTARAMVAGVRITSDICVIGGGPSGSTIAHRLASFGHDVCLVERHAFPRLHIGASLPPTILPLLEC